MPIRPENREDLFGSVPVSRNRIAHWGARVDDVLTPQEVESIRLLRGSLGVDVLAQPMVWEHIVARMLDGETTAHRSAHDIEFDHAGAKCYAEVKFSSESHCNFSPILGRDRSRNVFKWALPRGRGGKDIVDVIILIGRARTGLIYSWVLPLDAIAPRCASITVTLPDERLPGCWRWDRYAVPFDQILPASLRIIRGDYPPLPIDPREAERQRIRDKAGQLAFEVQCFGPAVLA